MRIFHLIYDHINNPWVAGGGAVRVYEIYKRLSDKHDITVACGRYPQARDYREGRLSFNFVGTERNNYILSTAGYALKAALFLKKNRDAYDIVIEDFAPYNPIFSFLYGKNIVLQLHQKEGLLHIKKYHLIGLVFILIEKIYPKFFRNLIAETEYNKNKFSLSGNAAVISNGFDEKLLNNKTTDGDYILFLGRLHINQKGLDILCDALKYIKKDKVKIILAGAGIDAEKVKKIFAKFVAADKVNIIGYAAGQKKIDLLTNCQYIVMPSRYEGQPLVLLEAAACGKPVIVSDIRELKYAVDAGFGLAFKSGDAVDLADKMRFLLRNESLRIEMGRKAREYAQDYTWEKSARRFEEFLLNINRSAGCRN